LGEFVTKSESGCRTAVRGHTAQLRMAISRVRLFADGLSKAKVLVALQWVRCKGMPRTSVERISPGRLSGGDLVVL